MTTTVENLEDLPEAIRSRFPVRVRVDKPHPLALERLAVDLREYAERSADLGERRIDLRSFYAFDSMRKVLGAERAATLLFNGHGKDFLDAIKIDQINGGGTATS